MFAVPGWSVDAKLLKPQTKATSKKTPEVPVPVNDEEDVSAKPTKKRKRSGEKAKGGGIDAENLADVWATVIEGKPKVKKGSSEKRQRIAKDGEKEDPKDAKTKTPSAPLKEEAEMTPREKQRAKKREKKAAAKQSEEGNAVTSTEKNTSITKSQPAKPELKLTPLQAAMRQKLISARFRHLNETLYTKPSGHSLSLFQENPEMFSEYHEGFRRQVEVWPENPVDSYISDIKARGALKAGAYSKPKPDNPTGSDTTPTLIPLPRTQGTCTIADLGCGDAALSQALHPLRQTLQLKIHSFDLQAPHSLITKADIANIPLKDGTVDVAIFCLALMGTNWIEFIEEAFRLLRWKGELWISEIKSRFGRVGKPKRVDHSVGNFHKKAAPMDKKLLNKKNQEVDDAIAEVEVDGHADTAGETDVSAFVEVLRKRGFVLRGEGKADGEVKKSVDLSNRMFVKMYFVKGASPIKGKCVEVPKGMERLGNETWKKRPVKKFIDEEGEGEEEVRVSTEASVLKPCVYKLR